MREIPASLLAAKTLPCRAILVGERLQTRSLEAVAPIALAPLMVEVGSSGVAALFRYGAVVFFQVDAAEQARFLGELKPLVAGAFTEPPSEQIEVRVDPGRREGADGEIVCLHDHTRERFQIVAEILARSVLLDLYEARVAENFDRIEPLALHLEKRGHGGRHRRELLKHIGSILLGEHKMVGRAEVVDKPELLWDHPELERLYQRLLDEFEVPERHHALERKLELVSRTVQTMVNLEHERRSLRVEWYIVILIMIEIGLFIYELFVRAP